MSAPNKHYLLISDTEGEILSLSSLETVNVSDVYKPSPFMIPRKEGNMHIGTTLVDCTAQFMEGIV